MKWEDYINFQVMFKIHNIVFLKYNNSRTDIFNRRFENKEKLVIGLKARIYADFIALE
jgi:hypothetical protein